MLTKKTLGKLSLIAAVAATLFSCEKTEPVQTDKPLAAGLFPTPNLTLSADTLVSTDSLIAYWPLDSCTLANDATGKGHNGTAFSTTLTYDRFGNTKGAYYFNGTSSYISVNDTADLRLTNTSYTLSAWVKLDNYNTSWGSNILTKHNGVPVGWGISINGQLSTPVGATFVGAGGGAINAHGTKVVTLNSWHMVSCTYNYPTQQVSIYVDGVLDTVTNGVLPANAPTNKLYIGRDDPAQPTNGYFLQGALDDIRIYKRMLSAAEILALYKQTAAPNVGLISHWPLSSCAGANDVTGLGHNGTASNITYTKDRLGNSSGASYFNGTNSSISVADKADIGLVSTSFTLNAWVKLDSYNTSWGSTILIKRNGLSTIPVGYGFSVEGQLYNPTGVTFFGAGGGAVNAYGTKVVGLSQWHMISNVYNVSTQQLSIYVDGVLDNVTSGILPINAVANKLYIGSDDPTSGSPGYFVKGAMEDLRIYNRALSTTEVKQLYTAVN